VSFAIALQAEKNRSTPQSNFCGQGFAGAQIRQGIDDLYHSETDGDDLAGAVRGF